MDPSETPISHHSACMETQESVFRQLLTQQFLGMLSTDCTLKASNPLQPFQDLLQPICRKMFKFCGGCAFALCSGFGVFPHTVTA